MLGQRLSLRSPFLRERPIVPVGLDGFVIGPIQRFASFVSRCLERRAERRSLQGLDDHMLKDIGISRCDVEREIRMRWPRG